jgi:hypothetical protein
MQTRVIQENDFRGNIKLSAQSHYSFYRYSLRRAQTGEHFLIARQAIGRKPWTLCAPISATWLLEKDWPRGSSYLL